MSNNSTIKTILLVTALVLIVCSAVFAQGGEFIPPFVEVNAFTGGNRFFSYQDTDHAYRTNLRDGIPIGGRATQNFTRYFALEERFQYSENNMRLKVVPGGLANSVIFGNHTHALSLEPVLYLTPRTSRFRFFLHGGPSVFWLSPTGEAKDQATSLLYSNLNASKLDMDVKFGGMYGAGFKAYLSRRFGFRFGFEGSIFPEPHFKIPGIPTGPGSVFIPTGGTATLYQVIGGIFFGFGRQSMEAPILPPAPPPPAARLDVEAPDVRTMDAGCSGEARGPILLSVRATTSLPGHAPSYQWNVNGQPAGENSPQFSFPVPPMGGQYKVAVTVTDDPAQSSDTRQAPAVTKDMLIVNVKDYAPPSINGSASPSEIALGQTAALSLTPHGTECNGQLTYSCKASEGSVIGYPPTQFNSTGVAFDMSDRSRLQTKTVNVNCAVTDARGATASTVIPVVVTLAAEARQPVRFDDVIFSAGSARVNNCGKRILLEEVYTQLNEHPDWDLVLVGHTAPNEAAGRLDRERVLNVAATLTAGTDTCPRLPLSRVRVALAGADQKSTPRPAFCGTSTRPRTDERRGEAIVPGDPAAQNRRVEVYLIPKGASIPDAASAMQVVAESEVAPRGCPK